MDARAFKCTRNWKKMMDSSYRDELFSWAREPSNVPETEWNWHIQVINMSFLPMRESLQIYQKLNENDAFKLKTWASCPCARIFKCTRNGMKLTRSIHRHELPSYAREPSNVQETEWNWRVQVIDMSFFPMRERPRAFKCTGVRMKLTLSCQRHELSSHERSEWASKQ